MSLPTVNGANYPTVSEFRDAMLRTIRLAYERRGLECNILPDSDQYIRAEALARRAAVIVQNNRLATQAMSPTSAEEEDLEALAAVYGLDKRTASSASGYLTVSVTGSAVIPAGFVCTAPDGQRYQTDSSTTVGQGINLNVRVVALEAGANTNQAASTVMTWESAAIGALSQTAAVDIDGLTGGSDTDTTEELRERLISKLTSPGQGGNSAMVRELALATSAGVDGAFVYCAVRGPGSFDVVIVSDDAQRELGAATVASVEASVLGSMPAHSSLNVTSVQTEPVDVVLFAKLPAAQSAGGEGGGWLDAQPWPRAGDHGLVTAYASNPPTVAVYTPSGQAPIIGQQIAFWSPSARSMTQVRITSQPQAVGSTFEFEIDQDLGFNPEGGFVSAACQNLSSYSAAFSAAAQALGPGEKTDSINLVPRSLRSPSPAETAPYDLTQVQLAAVSNDSSEVLDLSYAVRAVPSTYAQGTPPTFTERTTPSLPATTADAPRILTLNNFAIVAAP